MGSLDNPMHFEGRRRVTSRLLFIYGIKNHTDGGDCVSAFSFNGRLVSGYGEKAEPRIVWIPPSPSPLPLIDNSGMSLELYDLIRAGEEKTFVAITVLVNGSS